MSIIKDYLLVLTKNSLILKKIEFSINKKDPSSYYEYENIPYDNNLINIKAFELKDNYLTVVT